MSTLPLLLLLSCPLCLYGLKISEKQFGPYLTLTYVHGGEDAQMSHTQAREFCQNLTSELRPEGTTSEAPENPIETRKRSDLVSIHDPTMVHQLMSWVLPLDKRQFWIGGLISKVEHTFQHQASHVIHTWTDGTPANFRFLHFTHADFQAFSSGATLCLSVDFVSGKWGAHNCKTQMYFVCETINLQGKVPQAATTSAFPPTTEKQPSSRKG
ncbi:hypothetical protein CSKR_202203 [Clonorchis sinensis]|uniref:C-type lectin domain-containing protein n=1 Tax=Clonorchis sinensis TaxID=79923 RepID=A0A8T1LW83_CLOSI|nr:hypothetical protein CSKR_202203 [Clonorchis sinensis]